MISVNSTTNLQQAISGAIDGQQMRYGTRFGFAQGDYVLTDTLEIGSCLGLDVDAEVPIRTRIIWNGPPNKPVIRLSGCHSLSMRNLSFVFNNKATAAIEIVRRPGEKYISTGCHFENLWFGDDNPSTDYCVNIWNDVPNFDANNDIHTFERCKFHSYSKSAVRIYGGQIHAISFDRCDLFGSLNADYGVDAAMGAFFYWRNGSGGYHKLADFKLGLFGQMVSIDSWNSESSGGLLHSTQCDWNPYPISIANTRWQGDASKGYTVSIQHPGPLTIRNCQLASDTARISVRAAPLGGHKSGKIYVSGTVYCPLPYNSDNPLVIAPRDDYEVDATGVIFSTGGVPNHGDQPVQQDGQIVASPDQTGAVTPFAQKFKGDKTFLSSIHKDPATGLVAGIGISSVHGDGRMRIGSNRNRCGTTYWFNQTLATVEGTHSFEGATIGSGRLVFHKDPNQNPFSGGNNGLHVISPAYNAPNARYTIVAQRYADVGQPSIDFGAKEITFGTVADSNNGSGAINPPKMRISDAGIKIGNAVLSTDPFGNVVITQGGLTKTLESLLAGPPVDPGDV